MGKENFHSMRMEIEELQRQNLALKEENRRLLEEVGRLRIMDSVHNLSSLSFDSFSLSGR